MRRRGPVPKQPGDNFNMCCLAISFHRWDCTKVDRKYRADGPCGPVSDSLDSIDPTVDVIAALAWRSR